MPLDKQRLSATLYNHFKKKWSRAENRPVSMKEDADELARIIIEEVRQADVLPGIPVAGGQTVAVGRIM